MNHLLRSSSLITFTEEYIIYLVPTYPTLQKGREFEIFAFLCLLLLSLSFYSVSNPWTYKHPFPHPRIFF